MAIFNSYVKLPEGNIHEATIILSWLTTVKLYVIIMVNPPTPAGARGRRKGKKMTQPATTTTTIATTATTATIATKTFRFQHNCGVCSSCRAMPCCCSARLGTCSSCLAILCWCLARVLFGAVFACCGNEILPIWGSYLVFCC